MLSKLKYKVAEVKVEPEKIESTYLNYRIKALAACFIGYSAYYIVRNNFALSTPYLKEDFGLDATQIGLLSSVMLISYGISKAFMGVIADKANVKYFLAFGLFVCALINVGLGFSSHVWMFAVFIAMNGIFQGMGAVPAYITVSNWFPKTQRGKMAAIWNISQNIGGGVVAPIITMGLLWFGSAHWQMAAFMLPAGIAIVLAFFALVLGKSSPVGEGLPPLNQMYTSEVDPVTQYKENLKPPEDLSAWQICVNYVLPNKNVWYTVLVDVCVYIVRFGMISWMPLYILHSKGFTKTEMSVVFLVFEWAAIPSTLLAGWLTDKYFKGYRMPLAIIATTLMFFCVFGYWKGSSLSVVAVSAGLIGCLLYVPQLMANVQRIEIVPPFAVGSSVGLGGFMSYIVGSTIGTSLYGVMVDLIGWDGGIVVLFGGVIGCIVFCTLSHFGMKKVEKKRGSDALLHKYPASKAKRDDPAA